MTKAVIPQAVQPLPAAPRDRLAREPGRFTLDQAAFIAAPGSDPLALRYRTVVRLGYPLGEVAQFRPDMARPELAVPTFGLVGAGGVLPRHHTATVGAEIRKRSMALHVFLDLLGSRFTGLFVRAGAKYRPSRDPVPAERGLAAAIGMATPHLDGRLGLPLETLLFHAGNLAARTRSADRLQAMLEEETGGAVAIGEFAGGWLRLPPAEQTRLAGGGRGRLAEGQHARLGEGAVLGAETWDAQARFSIRLGPLDHATFEASLPGTPRHARVVALARLFAGLDTGFMVNPVLAAAEVPALALGRGARLGWSTWLTAPRPRRRDGTEARFEPGLIN